MSATLNEAIEVARAAVRGQRELVPPDYWHGYAVTMHLGDGIDAYRIWPLASAETGESHSGVVVAHVHVDDSINYLIGGENGAT